MIALETTVIVDGARPAWTVARKPEEKRYLVLFLDEDEAGWFPEASLEVDGQMDFDRFDG